MPSPWGRGGSEKWDMCPMCKIFIGLPGGLVSFSTDLKHCVVGASLICLQVTESKRKREYLNLALEELQWHRPRLMWIGAIGKMHWTHGFLEGMEKREALIWIYRGLPEKQVSVWPDLDPWQGIRILWMSRYCWEQYRICSTMWSPEGTKDYELLKKKLAKL